MNIEVLLTEAEIAEEFAESIEARDLPEKFFFWSPHSVQAWNALAALSQASLSATWEGLAARAADLTKGFGERVPVISFGAGDGIRDRFVLRALMAAGREVKYYPVDASQTFLETACAGAEDDDCEVLGIKADISSPVHLMSISRIGPGNARWRGRGVRWLARMGLMALRAIPEVVWALLLVRALGLGPAAGVLAIALTYGGMLGKVYAEILESGDTRPARALLEAGSGRVAALAYGLIPGASQELASYTVYRWECAVRASVVMGFVGAGGLGQLMDQSMKMLDGGEAATILATFLLLVLLADGLSAALRRVLA